MKSMLKIHGRAAVVVPDNVLFEGGAGEKVRRKLLQECDVHTLLRLPTGIFYAQGVKANVIFFDRKPGAKEPWTKKVWIYDLRTNKEFTLKERRMVRADLDEFVDCYHPENRHQRTSTWEEKKNPEGRWRVFTYEEIVARDKCSLDIFWLKDESLEDSSKLPDPHVLAAEIADDLAVRWSRSRVCSGTFSSGRPSLREANPGRRPGSSKMKTDRHWLGHELQLAQSVGGVLAFANPWDGVVRGRVAPWPPPELTPCLGRLRTKARRFVQSSPDSCWSIWAYLSPCLEQRSGSRDAFLTPTTLLPEGPRWMSAYKYSFSAKRSGAQVWARPRAWRVTRIRFSSGRTTVGSTGHGYTRPSKDSSFSA